MKKDNFQHIKTKENGFKVPKGYFDTVEDTVFAKLASEKLPKKEGFFTPTTYFETVEDNVLEKIQQEKGLQSTLPTTKKTGFIIPKNYLESVENTIAEKLNSKSKSVKVIDFKSILLKRIIPLTAAASLALFLFVNYNANNKSIGFDNIASSEIEQWIENDLVTLDTYEITEIYNDAGIENTTIFAEDESEDELVEYLNGTDVESLLIEN